MTAGTTGTRRGAHVLQSQRKLVSDLAPEARSPRQPGHATGVNSMVLALGTGESLGPYRICGALARWPRHILYHAFHEDLRRFVLIRQFNPEDLEFLPEWVALPGTMPSRRRFERLVETERERWELARRVKFHSKHGAVSFLDAFEEDTFYAVFAHSALPELRPHIGEVGPIDEDQLPGMLAPVLGQLGALHEHDLVYGALGPEQLFVVPGTPPRLVLVGFDAVYHARGVGAPKPWPDERPGWAPEFFDRQLHPDTTADIYSLSALLFFLLSGTYPHAVEDLDSALNALDRSGALCAAIRSGLDRDPARRPAGVAAFRDMAFGGSGPLGAELASPFVLPAARAALRTAAGAPRAAIGSARALLRSQGRAARRRDIRDPEPKETPTLPRAATAAARIASLSVRTRAMLGSLVLLPTRISRAAVRTVSEARDAMAEAANGMARGIACLPSRLAAATAHGADRAAGALLLVGAAFVAPIVGAARAITGGARALWRFASNEASKVCGGALAFMRRMATPVARGMRMAANDGMALAHAIAIRVERAVRTARAVARARLLATCDAAARARRAGTLRLAAAASNAVSALRAPAAAAFAAGLSIAGSVRGSGPRAFRHAAKWASTGAGPAANGARSAIVSAGRASKNSFARMGNGFRAASGATGSAVISLARVSLAVRHVPRRSLERGFSRITPLSERAVAVARGIIDRAAAAARVPASLVFDLRLAVPSATVLVLIAAFAASKQPSQGGDPIIPAGRPLTLAMLNPGEYSSVPQPAPRARPSAIAKLKPVAEPLLSHAVRGLPDDFKVRVVALVAGKRVARLPVRAARMIRAPSAQYPSHALRRGIEGWVEVAYDVNPDGFIENVRVTSAADRRAMSVFAREVVRAASGAIYSPAMRNGQPVWSRDRKRKFVFRIEG